MLFADVVDRNARREVEQRTALPVQAPSAASIKADSSGAAIARSATTALKPNPSVRSASV